MNCPDDVRGAVCEILRTALLRIRNLDNARASIEADHVHNLPRLLDDYRPDLLDFYLDVERDAFVRRSTTDDTEPFSAAWERLEGFARTVVASP